MKLEDEIKQKSFKSPQQKLAVNLLYTSNWLNAHYAEFFRDRTLTVQQFNVLRILRGQYPSYCSLKLVKERMLDRMSDASRIMDKLVAKKYVSRKQCPDDRRSVNLLITSQGLDLLRELDHLDEEVHKIFQPLSVKEMNTLNELLDKMRGPDKTHGGSRSTSR
jgi:DNA-binding MarR family transcriptional regulator